MTIKKKSFSEDEIKIFDEAIIYKRGEYWHFRMWLENEKKYARKSLRTRSQSTAMEKGKELYLELYANQKMGKAYFSLTTKGGVDKYLAHRQRDVESKLIVSGRLVTIKTHLQHWLDYIGRETKLKELSRTDCEGYFHHRMKVSKGNVKQVTLKNEQSTINGCMRYLFKQHDTHIDSFDFPKLPKVDRNNEAIRRATFTSEEYEKLVKTMRAYCAKSNKKVDADELIMRQLVRHYILIAANSGLRVGEQRQLRWSDVEIDVVKSQGVEKKLAKIRVRAETSKVRTSRIVYCRGGQYFERLKGVLSPSSSDALVFSVDGETEISKRALLYHFHKIVELADIEGRENRHLVPYSLRHFMITQRIMSGLSFRQVADMCGTSVAQIERTYYHLNDEIRLSNALAEYRRNEDGTIVPI